MKAILYEDFQNDFVQKMNKYQSKITRSSKRIGDFLYKQRTT